LVRALGRHPRGQQFESATAYQYIVSSISSLHFQSVHSLKMRRAKKDALEAFVYKACSHAKKVSEFFAMKCNFFDQVFQVSDTRFSDPSG